MISKITEVLTLLLIVFGLTVMVKGTDFLELVGPSPQMIEKIKEMPAFDLKDSSTPYDAELVSPLVRLEDDKGEFFCSGTVISNSYVLTAAHCLADRNGHLTKKKIRVKSIQNEKGVITIMEAHAAARNSRADYGLITGDFSGFNKMQMNTLPEQTPLLGTAGGLKGPVVSCGFPWGASDICYEVTGPVSIMYEGIAAKGILYPGMSGGPVVDLGQRKVIAINSAVGDGFIVIMPLVGLFETLGVKVVKDEQ